MSLQSRPTILVVDEDRESLEQSKRILNPVDYHVLTAECTEVAFSLASAYEVNLLLCETSFDCRFQSGLIAAIIALPDRGEIPVVFMSSGQAAGVIRRQHAFGGAYHVKKPFDAMVLITLIERTLWMPHLAQTHLNRPHFNLGPVMPALPWVAIPTVNSQE